MIARSLNKDLLVVLPGITATRGQCRQGEAFLKRHSRFDVLYVRFGMRWSTEDCASHVAQQLAPLQENYHKIHFLNYIRGGISFLTLLEKASIQNLGNVIFDRGSAAEQVAKRLFDIFGPFTRLLLGAGVVDVANWKAGDWQWQAPRGCRTGIIIEQGTSMLARLLSIAPNQIVLSPSFCYDEYCEVPESHDDVYTSPDFLLRSIRFFETGSFRTCGSKVPD